jgi:hypothetical protein
MTVFSVGFNGSYIGSAFAADEFATDTIVTSSGASPGPWTRRPTPALSGVNSNGDGDNIRGSR